jgi:hypothetical protein
MLVIDVTADFDGAEYIRSADHDRLGVQIARVFGLMKDANWRTLSEIADAITAPQASVSAQLRHLRKPKFGAHQVNRRARGDRENGLFEYQLIVAQPPRKEPVEQIGLELT